LTQEQTFLKCPTLEDGSFRDFAADRPDAFKGPTVTCARLETSPSFDDLTASKLSPKWRWKAAVPSLRELLRGRYLVAANKEHIAERSPLYKSLPTTPLKRVLRLLAFALMIL
jgi:hypothetical protein